MLTITPFLWFNNNVKEALDFYQSIFPNTKVLVANPGPDGKIFMAVFELCGQKFYALNGGPLYKFNEAVSMFIDCDTQEEVDNLWEKLSAGGEKSRCGWLKDPFGLWWQVVPRTLSKLMGDKDPIKAQRVMAAMMKMDKIVIADLEKAYNQE